MIFDILYSTIYKSRVLIDRILYRKDRVFEDYTVLGYCDHVCFVARYLDFIYDTVGTKFINMFASVAGLDIV